jgi:hypothetical protein
VVERLMVLADILFAVSLASLIGLIVLLIATK